MLNNNNNMMNLVKGIIVENTYELYENNDELQRSLENTELEFQNMTEEECFDKYQHIIDEYCQMCDNCGEWHLIEDLTSLTYQVVCQECLDYHYFTCEICDEICHEDELVTVFDNYNEHDICICESCRDNNGDVEYCEYHRRIEYDANDYFITVQEYGEVCQYAIENGEFSFCQGCDCTYHIDNLYYNEYDESYYCEDCYDENCGIVGSYHSSDFEFMTNSDEEEEIGLGFELELEFDRFANLREYAQEINDKITGIHLESDCSLQNGFECITNPMTINYFQDEFVTEIDKIVDICASEYNYDHNSAGFHVHMTKETPQQTLNLVVLVEYFKEELTTISNRTERQLKRWAPFYTEGIEKAEFDNNTIDILRQEIQNFPSRYHAVNTTNAHTNEIRIFKGGLDALEMKARVELCHNFNQYAKHNTIDVNNMPNFLEVATFDIDNYVSEYLKAMEI